MGGKFDNLQNPTPHTSKAPKCKGLFWRGTMTSYLSKHFSIEVRKSLRLLKRKSCTGCPKCEWVWEYFKDGTQEVGDYLQDIKENKIYTYFVHADGGEVDYLEFREVKNDH